MFSISKWRLRTLKWNVYVGRVVEQIIDVQKPQVLEKIVKVPKITQQVEDTQYRQSAVGENLKTVSSEQVANTRVQPTVNPVEVKHAQNLQDDDAEKAFTRTGKVPGEQASRRCNEGQDHQDESAVKENPTIQEKSQPREQAKKKFPRFEIPEEQFMGMSSARGGTEVGSNSPDRPEKRGD